MPSIYHVTGEIDQADLDIAFAEGCDVRFRADAYDGDMAREGCCPACGRYDGMHWIHSLGLWDRFGCDRCGHRYAIESHVAEEMGECSVDGCCKPATRGISEPWWVDGWSKADQHKFSLIASERRCCSTRCADDAGEEIADQMRDELSLRETEASLMPGRI